MESGTIPLWPTRNQGRRAALAAEWTPGGEPLREEGLLSSNTQPTLSCFEMCMTISKAIILSRDESSTRETSYEQQTQWPSMQDQVLSRARLCSCCRQGEWLNKGKQLKKPRELIISSISRPNLTHSPPSAMAGFLLHTQMRDEIRCKNPSDQGVISQLERRWCEYRAEAHRSSKEK